MSAYQPGSLPGQTTAKCFVVDSKGILHRNQADELREKGYLQKAELAARTNAEGRTGGMAEAIKGADGGNSSPASPVPMLLKANG